MIMEDYVSFETAKLLKEKGFDAECDYFYVDGELVRARGGACNWNYGETLYTDYKNECSAPTLQTVMKWLRETHDFNVNTELNIHGYFCSLSHIVRDLSGHIIDIEDSEAWETAYYDSYEQAVEAAIKYCLENLI